MRKQNKTKSSGEVGLHKKSTEKNTAHKLKLAVKDYIKTDL